MDNILDKMAPIIVAAGDLIINAQSLQLTAKSGIQNYATQVDIAVEDFLVRELHTLLPEAGFFAEEKSADQVLAKDYNFIIDPIDGTTNFIHHLNHSAISVALAYQNEIVAAIIYHPFRNELFKAAKNQGAYLNNQKITVSQSKFSDAMIAYGTSPYNLSYLDKTFSIVKKCLQSCRDARRMGAASLDLANLAAGRFDGYFEYRLQPWDFAAGLLLVKEAQGIVTNFSGLQVDIFSCGAIVAGNADVYPELFKLVKQ